MTYPWRRAVTAIAGQTAAAVLIAGLTWSVVPAAFAQTTPDQTQTLLDRVDRLQRDLNTLQRQFYQGGSGGQRSGTGAGAAPSGSVATTLEVRIQDLEEQLQNLRGQLEEASFQNKTLADRLDKLSSDIDFRLGALEKKAGLSAGGDGSPGIGGTQPSGTVFIPPNNPANDSASSQAVPEAPAPAQALPSGAPSEQLAFAMGLLNQNDYAGGERAFKEFLAQHPTDPLAGSAQYWLGRTYFARNNFNEAVRTFAEGYKKYPQSQRAPENLLYLGRSLAALNQKNNACQSFARMLSEYPKASDATKAGAQAERKKLACS